MTHPPSPSTPFINTIISQYSKHRIHMPACFADFLSGSVTHLVHISPTVHQQYGMMTLWMNM